ncbi:MAG: hypothetical protein KC620_07040 [Myxococcales bacterium]|nr:hypothetical protein [Myxococcales bacterium]
MSHPAMADDWAADGLPDGMNVDLHDAELEFVATAQLASDSAPAPYYAELITRRDGRRLVFRTFFNEIDQLGLHPKTRSRVDGLLRQRDNLFIDPRGGQPRCGELRGAVVPYPADDRHRCVVLAPEHRPAPLAVDPFATQKRIVTVSA